MMPLCTTATAAGLVRVGVAHRGRAVGRPAGVADAGVAADRVLHQQVGERDELADGAAAREVAVLQRGDAGAVVAAVLEPLQRLDEQRRDLVPAEDGDDAAHQEAAFSALSARRRSMIRRPRPGFTSCRPRAMRERAGRHVGDDRPSRPPTSAPSPTLTGATSAVFEPMKAPSPISVRCLKTPS